jgi:hypothetical protein
MERTEELQELLDRTSKELYGMAITEAQEKSICISCKRKVEEGDFRDKESKAEYRINAMCQACQNDLELAFMEEDFLDA